MAPTGERTPQERETLIFPTPDEAKGWMEGMAERLGHESGRGVRRRREIVQEEVSRQFERHGEGVGMIIRPWEHTPAEHEEVQKLVDVAFSKDLAVALRQARGSTNYPRNIDLFHDVLTTEMYELMREHGLHRQSVSLGVMVTIGIAAVVALAGIWFWVSV